MVLAKLFDRNMDYGLFIVVGVLLVIGVLMIHSTTTGEDVATSSEWEKQVVFAVIGVAAMLGLAVMPSRVFYALAYIFYAVGLLLLVMTEVKGTMGGGSERWLVMGPVRLQPSEFMKVAVILTLARWLSDKKNRPTRYVRVIIPAFLVLVPMALVLKQPDLSTALVFAAVFLPMLYWAGLDKVKLFFLVSPGLSAFFSSPVIPFFSWITWVAFMFLLLGMLYYARYTLLVMGVILTINIFAGIATPYIYNKLNPYQQKRITTIFNPEADPLGSGYQIISSKIAIGSGGVFGKGIGGGRYTELGFLPRSSTDFIFSVVGEEMGFIGAMGVILLFFFIVARSLILAALVKNQFMSITAVGIATVFAFHMFVNIGMVIGIMPVTGLPLPFLSYGGSSCLTNSIMIGLLLNISINRLEY